jgi:hypothetical protein
VIVPNLQILGLTTDLEDSTSGYLPWHTGVVSQSFRRKYYQLTGDWLRPQYSSDDGRKCDFLLPCISEGDI